jgi:hypothetical protein
MMSNAQAAQSDKAAGVSIDVKRPMLKQVPGGARIFENIQHLTATRPYCYK